MIRFFKKIFWGIQPAWLNEGNSSTMIWIPGNFKPPALINQSYLVYFFYNKGKLIEVLWTGLLDVKNGMYIFKLVNKK